MQTSPSVRRVADVAHERTIRRDAVGIGLAVGVYGVSFGVLAVAAGLSVAQACAMSLLVFTGASQFAFVGVIAAGGSALAAITSGTLLALRNGVYGVSLATLLPRQPWRRAITAQLVIDESTAMARAQEEPGEARQAFLATGLAIFVLWNAGTIAGALAGEALDDPRSLGLDAMFPAAFLALLAPQLRRAGAPTAAVCGALVAVALVPFTSAGLPVVAAIAGLLPVLLRTRRAEA